MTTRQALFATFVFLILSGCASQAVDKQHYFLPLSEAGTASSETVTQAPLLQLKQIQLTDFLDRDGLVLQTDDITLNQAKNHLWAEKLQQQIHRGLRERLNQAQQPFLVVGSGPDADLSLTVEIDAFHGRYDGIAITSGQWQLNTQQGEMELLKRFTLSTALSESGYPALVRALGQNLDKLAQSITEEISRRSAD